MSIARTTISLTGSLAVTVALASVGAPARAENRLVNPELDGGLAGWAASPLATWVAEDRDGCAGSGSARLLGDFETSVGLSQTMPWPDGSVIAYGAILYRFPSVPPPFAGADEGLGEVSGLVSARIDFHEAADCGDSPVYSVQVPIAIETYNDDWRSILVWTTSQPATTSCVRFGASWYWMGGVVNEGRVDALYLGPGRPVFEDGFEAGAGSSCRWSATAG